MAYRLITPTQLALFSRSPVIGAWWEETHATNPQRAPRPEAKALDELLFAAGLKHEELLVERLEADGKTVAKLVGKQCDSDYAATEAAMRSGADYIWQASLHNDELRGSADLLERVDQPSLLGSWSYIPIECKLSSHPKPIYLVQACAYCELLEPILGHKPDHFKLYLGGKKGTEQFQQYPRKDFWSWYELLRQRYRDFRASFDASKEPEDAPGDHGLWEPFITERLEAKRDLMLVAGMRQNQRTKLRAAGITTIEQLAALKETESVSKLAPAMLARLRDQARIQVASASKTDGRPAHEVRPIEQQAKGLAMLPAPDEGDIWFDMEGFPNPINGEKLEYLFGACYRDEKGEIQFQPWWAHNSTEEKHAFAQFVLWVQQRRAHYPNLHVYHYASYEKTALNNLASRHQIHQALIDQWLRDELLVDLFPIVRNGLLVGAPSYSIKKVERLYGNARTEEVESAADSVVQYAEWRKSTQPTVPGKAAGQSPLLQDLQDYNEKDCQVTEGLHRFLLNLPEGQQITPRANKWDTAAKAEAEEKETSTYQKDLEVAAFELLAELGDQAPTAKTKSKKQQAVDVDGDAIGPRGISRRLQRLLGQLIDFYEREGRVEWSEFFRRLQMTPEEREDDSEVIAAAQLETVERIKNSFGFRYRFDASQPLKLAAREGRNPRFALVPLLLDGTRLLPLDHLLMADGKAWSAEGLLEENQPDQVTMKATGDLLAKAVNLSGNELPQAADLVPLPKLIYRSMLKDLVRQAQGWVGEGTPLPPALLHLLERRTIPELEPLNQRVRQAPSTTAAELTAFLKDADGLGLCLQGPPGTGKTTVTGEVIAQLVQSGQRVAVSSNSNEAINNVLRKAQECLDELGSNDLVVKASSSASHKADVKSLSGTRAQALKEADLPDDPAVLGGTVFTLVKEAYDGAPFDLLVIDEAGQVSLSNLLYMSKVARNILLVGDQQQLSQPCRADHPGESGLSCLDYVMQDHAVVPADRGVFLATSWRMPPPLTEVVSELFYEGQLQAASCNTANQVHWDGPKQGLVFEAVPHSGNSTLSEEEVEHIAALVERLHGQPYQRARLVNGKMTTENGELGREEILITAPYNMQVNSLQKRIGHKARIGTVDKFQGQEAPVAIHSLTASDGESAPRGIDFLLDPNRLNVATSRAQCLSIVVGSPELATGISNSIANVQRLNRLCSVMQAAIT
ncbi:TM0106 family RecB-like putative nuclease [Cyanobium sp. WKJ7-Wakatipu]|uniref:TM0106 family RecB-like putative nuclease n=1 Tax=Cyanobium sp. WKJ7-Wakatipu TaxID=2823726 RepID=UPI0020CF7F76|nr:TM0106 family RecB-like putative nuclease [Cyanobium sp. WKJ7-Wakatipu]MCP9784080.1 TM0106 family RecB-like putative nuclease [Cyanobium sp. WKJ7-Wakatipu]